VELSVVDEDDDVKSIADPIHAMQALGGEDI
jgi:hypothetical protein